MMKAGFTYRISLVRAMPLLVGFTFGACSTESTESPIDQATEDAITRLQAELTAAATTATASPSSVRPSLTCVDKVSSSTYRAHFGYTNSSTQSISIPIGFYNRFWPSPQGRGQQTAFPAGTQADVIQVTFASNSAIVWILGSGIQVATSTTKLCPLVGGTGGAGTGGAGGKGGAGGGTGGKGGTAGVGAGGAGTGGAGQCPSTCDDRNPCTVDLCNASTSFQCSHVPNLDGTTCSDGNACTTGDKCVAGACSPGTARICLASDQCHSPGVCDTTSGSCSNPAIANGTACTDNNACTTGDSCQAGVCTPGSAKICTASDQCHGVGTCAPATGVCSNPARANGTSCDDGNVCTTGDTCQSGVCTPTVTLSPTHCGGAACDMCSFDPDAGNCVLSTVGCDQFSDAGDRSLCENAYACFTDPANHCLMQGDPLQCWCGTNGSTCFTDNAPPTQANGPCLSQVFAAAKTTDATTIKLRLVDPDYPLGRAVNLTVCRGEFCSQVCQVP